MSEPGPPVAPAAPGPSLLRRRWLAVLVGLLIGLAAGQLFTELSTPRYSSTTAVLVLPTRTTTAGATTGAPSDVNMNTESELVRSAQVARGAADRLGGTATLEEVLERLSVTVPANSQVLSISYADRTAERARSGAEAVAQSYLTSRQEDVRADVERLTGALRKDLEFAEEQLRLATDQAASLPSNSPDRVYAEAQRDILGNQITNLNSRLTTLTASTDRAGVIITEAVLPARASFPVPALDLAAGLVLGLLLGAALALLVDRLDHRLRRGSDVVRRTAVPVLADLRRTSDAARPAVFDHLRLGLDGRGGTTGPVQVSDLSGRGASASVALELARSWARVNGATTLVLAHRGSSLPDGLDLSGRAGLSDLLRGRTDLRRVLHDVPGQPGLLVVPAGREPDELEHLLQSPAAPAALASLRTGSAALVVETASSTASAAAQSLVRTSSAVVLVVEVGSDDRAVSREVQGVRATGGDVAGVVLVPRTRRGRAAAPAPAALPAAADDAGWADGTAAPASRAPERVAEATPAGGVSGAAQRPPQ